MIRGTRLPNTATLLAEGGPGSYTIEAAGLLGGLLRLLFVCPCGCGTFGSLRLGPATEEHRQVSAWDGERDAPSVQAVIELGASREPHWRGHLNMGDWWPC